MRAGGGGGVTSAHPATPTLRRPVLGPRGWDLLLQTMAKPYLDSSALPERPWLLMGVAWEPAVLLPWGK